MSEKTVADHRLNVVEKEVRDLKVDIRDLRRDVGFLQRAIWWAVGAATGIGALATSMMTGILKRIAS